MKVSVIIPVYNGAEKLPRCLESLRGQTLRDIEMIFIDDASTDGTGELLRRASEEDPRIRIITHDTNLTACVARNEGIRAASGAYITFVDGDDTLLPDSLEKLVAEMERAPVDILHFGAKVINAGNVPQNRIDSNQKALAPHLGTLRGAAVFRSCFQKRKYGFNLWGKLYDARLCKRAAEVLVDKPMAKAQDLYLFWVLAWFAQSYRGIETQYYQYYFGDGLSGRQSIGPVQFRRVCGSSAVARELRAFMAVQDPQGTCTDILEDRCRELASYCMNVLLNDVTRDKRPECLALMAHAWTLPVVLDQLSRRFGYDTRRIFEEMAFFHTLPQPERKPVRTVGMYYYWLYNGGVQRTMAQLAWVLTRQGYRVVLFTDQEPQEGDYALPAGVERVVMPEGGNQTNPAYQSRGEVWMREIARHQVDVMVYHAWLNRVLPWDMLAIRAAGARFVIHTHSVAFVPMINMRQMAASLPYTYRVADGVVTLSRTDQRYWRKFNAHVSLVHNPVDETLLEQEVSSLDHGRILWLGRLADEKQPLDAVNIMARVHARCPEAKMTILGSSRDGGLERLLKSQIAALGLQGVVELVPFTHAVTEYYRQSDVFLMTSAYEGYSLTLQESKSMGLPCVTYAMPYLELCRLPDGGMVSVPQGDVGSAANAVCELLEDEACRRRMGEQARRSLQEIARQDLGALWQALLEELDQPGEPEIDQQPEERLLTETMLDFLGRSSATEATDYTALYGRLPWPLRKLCMAWQVQHDLGMKHMLRYALEKLGLKRQG